MIKPSELKELGFKELFNPDFYEKKLNDKYGIQIALGGSQDVYLMLPESSMQLYEGEDLSKEILARIITLSEIAINAPKQKQDIWFELIKKSIEGAIANIEMSKEKQFNQDIKDYRKSMKELNDKLVDEEWKRPVTFEGCCPLPFVCSVKKDIPQPEAPKSSPEDYIKELYKDKNKVWEQKLWKLIVR